MTICIFSATTFEVAPLQQQAAGAENMLAGHKIDFLISGVGLLASTFSLSQYLAAKRPDLVIQAGIAGAFDESYALASAVVVAKEYLGDLGVEENGAFHDLFDMGFTSAGEAPFTAHALANPYLDLYNKTGLPAVNAITVNEITTAAARIEQLRRKYQPVCESMEGAALHYVCLKLQVPFLQVRTLSNRVGERNKQHWKLDAAKDTLNNTLYQLLTDIR